MDFHHQVVSPDHYTFIHRRVTALYWTYFIIMTNKAMILVCGWQGTIPGGQYVIYFNCKPYIVALDISSHTEYMVMDDKNLLLPKCNICHSGMTCDLLCPISRMTLGHGFTSECILIVDCHSERLVNHGLPPPPSSLTCNHVFPSLNEL